MMMMMTWMRMRLSKMMLPQGVEDGKMACQQQGEHSEVEPTKDITERFKSVVHNCTISCSIKQLKVIPFRPRYGFCYSIVGI